MKLFKRFGVVVVAILFMFVGAAPAFALDVVEVCNAAGTDCRILDDEGETFFRPVNPSSTEYRWHAWQTTDGKPAYCYDMLKERPTNDDGIEYIDNFGQMDVGVAYILKNGAADPMNPTNQERWITQGAIWLYRMNGNDFGEPKTDPHNVLPIMQDLVARAKAAKASGEATSGIINGVQLNNDNLTLEDGYYVSSDITPNVKGTSEYTVSLSGATGAEVVSNSGSTIPAGSSFKVRVPASNMSGKVTVTVSVQTNAYIINPAGNSEYQNMVYLSQEPRTVSETVELSPKVCVDYKIVGNVIPDASLTDPTPGKNCFEWGTPYDQEKELTTRTDCTFKGWFTKDELTGKWIDGTALNKDMTLYGAWDCPQVQVPPTAAGSSLIIVGAGLVVIAVCGGVYFFKNKKQKN